MEQIIDLLPNKTRKISAETFLNLNEQEKKNVKSCRFEPPHIGSRDFGQFTITLKTPTYSIDNGKK